MFQVKLAFLAGCAYVSKLYTWGAYASKEIASLNNFYSLARLQIQWK